MQHIFRCMSLNPQLFTMCKKQVQVGFPKSKISLQLGLRIMFLYFNMCEENFHWKFLDEAPAMWVAPEQTYTAGTYLA